MSASLRKEHKERTEDMNPLGRQPTEHIDLVFGILKTAGAGGMYQKDIAAAVKAAGWDMASQVLRGILVRLMNEKMVQHVSSAYEASKYRVYPVGLKKIHTSGIMFSVDQILGEPLEKYLGRNPRSKSKEARERRTQRRAGMLLEHENDRRVRKVGRT
jgi:hypothetical protein